MRIGEIEIDLVLDGVLRYDPTDTYGPGTLPDEPLDMPFGGFLLRGPGDQVIVHDTGAGPAFPTIAGADYTVPQQGLLPDSLRQLGISPDDVTDVVYSHLHSDHTGWAPLFSRARHHIHVDDWRIYVDGNESDAFSSHTRTVLQPLREAVQLWDTATQIAPWLRLIHVPGHTPGSAVGLVESDEETAALVGDLFHHPVELRRPELRLPVDGAPDEAASQRSRWLQTLRRTHAVVFAPHFPDMAPVWL